MESIAFPMRLRESGLLERNDAQGSIVALLQMMARTPQGSWAGCPGFGLRDLFEEGRLRADAARLAQQRIEETFRDLGITRFAVTEVVREIGGQREVDVYAVTLQDTSSNAEISTQFVSGR